MPIATKVTELVHDPLVLKFITMITGTQTTFKDCSNHIFSSNLFCPLIVVDSNIMKNNKK